LRAKIDLQFNKTRGLCLAPALSNNNVCDLETPYKWRNPASELNAAEIFFPPEFYSVYAKKHNFIAEENFLSEQQQ